MLWMVVTVIPYTFGVLLAKWTSGSSGKAYRVARAWLKLSVDSARVLMGIQYRVQGMDNLPTDGQGVVLLVKHQSTYETFLMPSVMPRPLAYVFKKELLKVPFFGWSIGALDMIHIDRAQGSRAFHKVVEQGKRLLDQGIWVIMFPEGTRVNRGEVGDYKTGATRLAIMTGASVVPVAVTSAKCWPRKAFIKKPGVVDVSIGKPISSVGRKHDELMAEVQAWIESEMQRLDPEAYRK
jgi:1-acyl-sn-glycerol-3-phosphate acyltransferase